jgi:uracil-DNA glycosylase family 4
MSCPNCPRASACISPDVPGRGSAALHGVLLVGPEPTTADDLAGEVMSGRIGVLLDGLMADAGFKPDEWRVVSAVRCPGKCGTAEIDACRELLKDEIHEFQPSTIVALGDIALRALCRQSGLTSRRGTDVNLHPEFEYESQVFPTYSPQMLLVVPKVRNTVVSDLRRAHDRLKKEESINYVRKDIDCWTASDPTALDVETDFFVTGGDTIVQWAVFDGKSPATVSSISPRYVTGPIIGHNSWAFDVPVLQRNGANIQSIGDDTMVLAYLDDEAQPRGLEALSVKYLGVKGWKEGLHAEIGSEEFAAYNARDVENTYRLWEVLCDRLGPRKRIHDHIMRPAFGAFEACSERGLFINQRIAAEWEAKYAEEQGRLRQSIVERTGIGNPNSPRQVASYLFGNPRHSSDVAHLLASSNPIAKDIIAYRHAGKMLSTFVRPYSKLGRIHFPYNILGTDSGRVSARHHNMPRELKAMFGAPKGKCYASVDYSAIEFRFAVWLAGCAGALDEYIQNPDFDPHSWFAGHFYGIDSYSVTKEQRQIAKSGNFGLLYKSSAEGLAQYAFKTSGIRMSLTDARNIRSAWLDLLPEVLVWWDSTSATLRKQGYIESVSGRRRHFGNPELLPKSGGLWNEMVRQAVNHTIQSPCTDIAQLGLVACHERGFPINGFFHDAITFEWDSEEEAHACEDEVRRAMVEEPINKLRDIFGIDITVPLTVEFTYVPGEG